MKQRNDLTTSFYWWLLWVSSSLACVNDCIQQWISLSPIVEKHNDLHLTLAFSTLVRDLRIPKTAINFINQHIPTYLLNKAAYISLILFQLIDTNPTQLRTSPLGPPALTQWLSRPTVRCWRVRSMQEPSILWDPVVNPWWSNLASLTSWRANVAWLQMENIWKNNITIFFF